MFDKPKSLAWLPPPSEKLQMFEGICICTSAWLPPSAKTFSCAVGARKCLQIDAPMVDRENTGIIILSELAGLESPK